MNNSICTLFDNILIDIHKFKSLRTETYKTAYSSGHESKPVSGKDFLFDK